MKTKKIYMQPTSRAITVDESEIIATSGEGEPALPNNWGDKKIGLKFDLFNLDNDGQSDGNIEEEGFAD